MANTSVPRIELDVCVLEIDVCVCAYNANDTIETDQKLGRAREVMRGETEKDQKKGFTIVKEIKLSCSKWPGYTRSLSHSGSIEKNRKMLKQFECKERKLINKRKLPLLKINLNDPVRERNDKKWLGR